MARFKCLEEGLYLWSAPKTETLFSIECLFQALHEAVDGKVKTYALIIDISKSLIPSFEVQKSIKENLINLKVPPCHVSIVTEKNVIINAIASKILSSVFGKHVSTHRNFDGAVKKARQSDREINPFFWSVKKVFLIFEGKFLVSLTLLATVFVMFLPLGLFLKRQEKNQLLEKYVQRQMVYDSIVYLDEVLTMSARMFAFTGDIKWKERYQKNEILLDQVLERLEKLNNSVDDQAFLQYSQLMSISNQNLVLHEKESFQKAQSGNLKKSQQILMGDRYLSFKKEYSEAVLKSQHLSKQNLDKSLLSISFDEKLIFLLWLMSSIFWCIGLFYLYYTQKQQISLVRKKIENESFFETVIENIPNMVFVKEAGNLCFTLINSAGERILGLKREEIIGKNDFDFFPHAQASFFQSNDREVLKKHEVKMIEEEAVETKNGLRFLRTRKVPLFDVGGRARFLLGISEDITMQKMLTEESLLAKDIYYKTVIEFLPHVVWFADSQLSITYINKSIENITGESLEKNLQKGWVNFIHPDDLNDVFEKFKQAKDDPKKNKFEGRARLIHKNKEIRDVYYSGAPFMNSHGQIAHWAGVVVDVTEQERLKRLLLEKEERLQLAVQGSSVGVWDWMDLSNDRQYWSPKFYEQIGYTPEEYPPVRSNFREILHPDDRPGVNEAFEKHLKHRVPFDSEFRLNVKNKGYRWFRVTAQAKWDELGRPVRVAGAVADIHEKKLAQEALKNTQLQLVQSVKLAALGEMSSGLAHELNNPLLFIKGFNNRIKAALEKYGSVSKKEIGDLIQEIDYGADRMNKIIQHFRDFSRQSKNEMKVCSLNEIIEKSFDLFFEQLKLRDIVIKKNLSSSVLLVNVDANRLEQVFVNLINNSRDALIEINREIKEITVDSMADEEFAVVRFADNGCGIAKENLDKIFNPFFTTKEVGKGTGLGLSISHGIIKDFGGEITAESELGKGSVFFIRLPLVDSKK